MASDAPKPDHDEKVKIDLPFEEAMRGLLEVDPDADPVEDEDSDSSGKTGTNELGDRS